MDKPTILIIDDDPALLKLYGFIIENAGYQLITANDARTAIDALKHTIPQLIIQDLSLPDLNGLQLIHCIQQQPNCASIPIIIVSGSLGRIEAARLSSKSFAAFLHKPFEASELLEAVSTCLVK